MLRWHKGAIVALSLLLVGVLLAIGYYPTLSLTSGDVLQNGGFEQGTAGWNYNEGGNVHGFFATSTADVFSGKQSGLLTCTSFNATSGFAAVYQKLNVQTNLTYCISLYYKGTFGYFAFQFADYSKEWGITVPPESNWTLVEFQTEPLPPLPSKGVWLSMAIQDVGSIAIDNVSIIVVQSQPSQTGLILNGGLEDGQIGWVLNEPRGAVGYTGSFGVIASDSHSGNHSGQFSVYTKGTGGWVISASQEIRGWEVGKTYKVTLWHKGNMTVYPDVFAYDAAFNQLGLWGNNDTLSPTEAWTETLFLVGPIPQGTVHLNLHFDSGATTTGTFLFDDVSMYDANSLPKS